MRCQIQPYLYIHCLYLLFICHFIFSAYLFDAWLKLCYLQALGYMQVPMLLYKYCLTWQGIKQEMSDLALLIYPLFILIVYMPFYYLFFLLTHGSSYIMCSLWVTCSRTTYPSILPNNLCNPTDMFCSILQCMIFLGSGAHVHVLPAGKPTLAGAEGRHPQGALPEDRRHQASHPHRGKT